MAATYEPIATTTLSSAASSITFSSIASSWTDLRLVFVPKFNASAANYSLYFNGDTGTTYSITRLSGDGANAASYRGTNQSGLFLSQSPASGAVFLSTIDIFSYAGSTYKTCLTTLSGDKNGSGNVNNIVGLWRSTSAITSILIDTGGSAGFDTGTTATLYGIKAA